MPTETAVLPIDLSVFEDVIQKRLQMHCPEMSPLQASCTLKQQTLLMVVQHPLPALSHPMRVFRQLEVIFHEQKLDQRFRGLMYLQVEGEVQPYAFHNFTPPPPEDDVAAQVRATTPAGLHERGETTTSTPETLPTDNVAIVNSDDAAPTDTAKPNTPLPPNPRLADIDEQLEPPTHRDRELLNAELPHGELPDGAFSEDRLPEFMTTDPTEEELGAGRGRLQLSDRLWLPLIAIGSVLGMGVFFVGLYAMSRPCVLLGCENIPIAQELANQSIKTLKAPPSGKAVLQAQAQLEQSLDLLVRIPSWSRRHAEAQALITTYGATAEDVADLVNALQAANRAAELTQEPPLPLEAWQAAVEQWEIAIAGLDTVPPTSEFYRFARKKIQEYRKNLAIVTQRRDVEKDAAANLAAAQEAAKIAQVRENLAQSVADLQLAHSTWQTAVKALKAIPANSIAAEDAQNLLQEYQPQADLARDRQSFEKFANDAYAQALRLAEKAQAAQQQNQWSAAIGHWKQALGSLNQISPESFSFVLAQPLVQKYQDNLSRAESRRSGALQLQQVREEIEKICTTENPRICVFAINREKLTVRLTDNYIQRIRQKNQVAQTQGNVAAQVMIQEHLTVLEQSLEKISDRVGVPLEIFTPDNVLVKSHTP